MHRLFATAALASATTFAVAQNNLLISVGNNLDNELAGLTFRDGDVVRTNPAGTSASLFLSELDVFATDTDVDGFHYLPNGNVLISTLFNNTFLASGNAYLDGDIVEYNPATGADSLFFGESNFSSTGEDISALTLDAAGTLLFATWSDATISGITVAQGDIISWNGSTASVLHQASSIFDSGSGSIYGMHAMPDGSFLLSPGTDTLISGLAVRDGDIVRWNPATDSASLYFSEDSFGGNVDDDIYALALIPSPGTLAPLALAGLLARRRRN